MSQLRQQQERLDELQIDVKVVAFDNDVMAMAYVKSTGLQWPLLLDTDRELYAQYGMHRGSWWDIYSPTSIAKYIRLMIGGKKPGKPGSDWQQMGGDVLIDPDGIVRIHHVSTNPHDRPTAEEILSIVDGGKQATFNEL